MKPVRSDMPYPDAPRVIGHIASLYGLRCIVDAGLAWHPELGLRYGKLRVTGVTAPGLAAGLFLLRDLTGLFLALCHC